MDNDIFFQCAKLKEYLLLNRKIIIFISAFILFTPYFFLTWKASQGTEFDFFLLQTGFWKTRDLPCIDLFLQGELYQGQLACAQGPITYIVGGILKLLFGQHFFTTGLLIFLSALALMLFYIVLNIANYSFLTLFIFFFLIIPFVFVDIASSLSTIFLVSSLFFLYKSTSRKRIFIAGVCGALAFFSKTTSLTALTTLIPITFFYYIKTRKDRHATLQFIQNTVIFLAGLSIVSVVIIFMYPNSLAYSFLSHLAPNTANPQHVLAQIFSNTYAGEGALHVVFATLVLLFFIAVSSKHASLIPILLLMGTLIPMYLGIVAVDNKGKTILFDLFFENHIFAYLLIFSIGCVIIFNTLPSRAIRGTVLITFFWIGIFSPQSADAQYFIKLPSFLEKQDIFDEFLNKLDYSTALVDFSIARRVNKPVFRTYRYNSIRPLEQLHITDTTYGAGLMKLGLYNTSKNEVIVNFNKWLNTRMIVNSTAEFQKNNFSMVVVGPWKDSPLYLGTHIALQNKLINATDVCTLYVPDFLLPKGGTHFSVFIFFANKTCEKTRELMSEFFVPRIQTLCSEEYHVLRQTLYVLRNMSNVSGINETYFCAQTKKKKETQTFFNHTIFFILFSSLAIFSFITYNEKRQRFLLVQLGLLLCCALAIIIAMNLFFLLL